MDKAEQNVTTEEHFRIFQEESLRWIEFFGLKGWQVEFRHENVEGKNYRAACSASLYARTSALTLTVDWKHDPVTELKVRRSAFHEVCELFFSRIEILANDRTTNEDMVREEIHHIIRTMENTVFQTQEREAQR